jgi:restriction system protein
LSGVEVLRRARAISPSVNLALLTAFQPDTEQGKVLSDLSVLRYSKSDLGQLIRDVHDLAPFTAQGIVDADGNPIGNSHPYRQQVITAVAVVNDEVLRKFKADPQAMRQLSSREFEELIAELLMRQGYDVTLTPPSGDGGFDMFAARKEGLGRFLYLVECKRYTPPNKVGVEIVRSLKGVLDQHRATGAAVVTTSFFTSGALAFQREFTHQLQLHDYIALQQWFKDS